MTEFSQKWAVAAFFDDLPDGFEFQKNEVPLHATLAGVFAIDLPSIKIAGLLEGCVRGFEAPTVTGDAIEQWGSLKVTTLRSSQEFKDLFTVVQDTLLEKGAVFNEPEYVGAGFRPHVTLQRSGSLSPGAAKSVKGMSLVDMFPNGDPNRRRIVKTIKLPGKLV